MAVKLKGLGRGLDALLMPEPTQVDAPAAGVTSLKVGELIAGQYQPRRRFDDASLAELAASIKAQGIMQPIVVRRTASGKHEIIAGERRFRAARLAGLADVPVIVKEVDDKTALTLALIENLQRQDLNAIEEAHGLQRLIAEFSFTHEQAAEAVGKSRSAVSNLLRLLDLAAPVQERVIAGTLEMGHARALATLPKDRQVMLAEKIAINGLSVRATEALVKEASGAAEEAGRARRGGRRQGRLDLEVVRDPDLDRLETELADALGTYVSIAHHAGGQGELIIRYASLDQLDGLIARIKR
ncbi:MAG: ParB/RepB/Spo0J family partition protein [Burkholderiales bacterium]|nr:ParB/RepB/Spo0J family partition protein [Pseudomonadota bacterium]MCC7069625.1 ParB/RepB/Spo0J family partition protein [Burkholderiales bacterium]